jgi:glycerophosphoryl diester phosphodiesterase
VSHLELDVQLSADRVPLLLHDADFRRMGGRAESVFDLDWSTISSLPMGEPARFGSRYAELRPCSLAQFADALAGWPGITTFVEIKRASLRRFGQDVVLERVMACLTQVRDRCVIISFDRSCLEPLRRDGSVRTGWVLDSCDEGARAAAETLAPQFLFCDLDRLPSGGTRFWSGPWEWAIYEIRDAATARAVCTRGAAFVETMTVRALMSQLTERGPPHRGGRDG